LSPRARGAKLALSLADAAILAVLSKNYLLAAIRAGERAVAGPYYELRREIEYAEAVLKMELVGIWAEAAEYDWRAALAFLSRRYPERWAR
jgi:hypothetical protein